MRTISDDVTVRLYHVDPDSGTATTLLYGSLGQALAVAAQQDDHAQEGLFIQTSNDVINYLDFIEG